MRPSTAWCLYDVGNSAFATTVMAAVLPVYFSTSIAIGLDPDPERARVLATSTWGYANTIAMALTALSAPIIGAVADAGGGRKRILAFFAFAGALTTALLALGRPGDWMFVAALFVMGRVFFSSSIVMYDSLLPHVAKPEDLDQVSAKGFAWGYLGGGILLALQLALIMKPELFGIRDSATATRIAFVSVAIWWSLFTIPLLKRVPEGSGHGTLKNPVSPALLKTSFLQLRQTFGELRKHREALKFLAAFWFYNDGIGTIVVMAAAFGAEIGLTRGTLIGAILMVQFLGFPFAILFGRISTRIGPRNAIMIGLVGYMLLCGWAWFVDTPAEFWSMAVGVSMFQGGCQALSRSLFARMIPAERSSEFFGFYDVSSKFAGVIGPLLLATVARSFGSSRAGVFALVILFAIGIAILSRVNVEKAARHAAG